MMREACTFAKPLTGARCQVGVGNAVLLEEKRRRPEVPTRKPQISSHGSNMLPFLAVIPGGLIRVLVRRRSIREKTDVRTIHHFPNSARIPTLTPPPGNEPTNLLRIIPAHFHHHARCSRHQVHTL